LQTLLKILSRSVACLDDVHHNHLLQLVTFIYLSIYYTHIP